MTVAAVEYAAVNRLDSVQPAPKWYRVSFRGNVVATYGTFQTVWDGLFGIGVIPASPRPSEAPQVAYGVVNVIDLHSTAGTGNLTVEALADRLDHLSVGADVVRVEQVSHNEAGDPGAIDNQQQTDQQNSATDPLTDPLAKLARLLGTLGKGALIAGALVLAIVVVDKLPRVRGRT